MQLPAAPRTPHGVAGRLPKKRKLTSKPAAVVQRRIRWVLLRRAASRNSRSTMGKKYIFDNGNLCSNPSGATLTFLFCQSLVTPTATI
jgi:hypothetical protein